MLFSMMSVFGKVSESVMLNTTALESLYCVFGSSVLYLSRLWNVMFCMP